MSVDLKTLRFQKFCKKCKPEVILVDDMFDCEKCDKMSSEIACLKISKAEFTMDGVNERFNLTALKEIVKVCYLMPISRKKELGKKMLKTTIKVASNTEDRKVESMQCFSKNNNFDIYWLFIVLFIYFI